MKRKGELTTQQLVTLIILIVSFGIILFLIFNLGLGETTNKEICHNSVLLKSKSVVGGELDCKTNYICISGGGKCEGFNEDYTIKIDMNPKAKSKEEKNEKIKNQTMKAIADEMTDCWWMFGEGKIDYVGLSIEKVIIGKMNCALCSIISFDKKIQEFGKENENKFTYENFYDNFLRETKKDKSNTYLSYLYNVHNFEDVTAMIKINKDEFFEFEDQYSILTGIGSQGYLQKTANWIFVSVDLVNKYFFRGFNVPKAPQFKDYGTIPVVIKNKKELNSLDCTDFITKA